MANYKPAVRTNPNDEFSTNSLVFATKEEAEGSAACLMDRWLAVVDWSVVETDKPVNYKHVGGKDTRLELEPETDSGDLAKAAVLVLNLACAGRHFDQDQRIMDNKAITLLENYLENEEVI